MFYAKGNNTKQEINLNTNFYTSYSETAQVTAGGWNNQLAVKIKPCIGQDANGIRQYAEDRSQIIATSITPENAICLTEGFEARVLPAIQNNSDASVSIVMGTQDQRKILTIGYENGNSYLAIAVGLDETGKASTEIKHIFNKKGYLVDYKPDVGNPVEQSVEADLFNFIEKVRSVKDLAPIVAHSIKFNDMNRAAFTNNNNSGSYQNTQVNQVSNTNTGYQAPVSTSTNMDDFLPF